MFVQFYLLFSILIQFSENLKSNTLFVNNTLEYLQSFSKLSEDSAVGMYVRGIRKDYYTRRINHPPTIKECKPAFEVAIGYLTYHIVRNPFGNCIVCCKVIDPHHHITLYWINKSNIKKITKLKVKNVAGELSAIKFNSSMKTIIYIHGYTQNGLGYHARKVYDAYMSRDEEYNIISVDWKTLAAFPWYIQAKLNTELVASYIASFLQFYISTGELLIKNIHVIGFSLGSHIAGMIGKKIKNIPRITGLDTAFPIYKLNDTSNRLIKTDAKYVDIIHTDPGRFGFPISIGHSDFYPNYGKLSQPGCTISDLEQLQKIEAFGFCDHYMAVEFYAESVRNPFAFPSTKCNLSSPNFGKECVLKSDSFMGFLSSRSSAMGNFYLQTKKPLSLGKHATI